MTGGLLYANIDIKSRTSDNGPPRSGQPPNSGYYPCYGLKLFDSGQRTKSVLPTALSNTELPLNNGHQETTPLKLYPRRTAHTRTLHKTIRALETNTYIEFCYTSLDAIKESTNSLKDMEMKFCLLDY